MRLIYSDYRDWDYISNKNEFKYGSLTLYSKNEKEFMEAWEKIKDIPGVEWCGCPAIEENEYSDTVALIRKKRHNTISEIKEELGIIRKQINKVLSIGRDVN